MSVRDPPLGKGSQHPLPPPLPMHARPPRSPLHPRTPQSPTERSGGGGPGLISQKVVREPPLSLPPIQAWSPLRLRTPRSSGTVSSYVRAASSTSATSPASPTRTRCPPDPLPQLCLGARGKRVRRPQAAPGEPEGLPAADLRCLVWGGDVRPKK